MEEQLMTVGSTCSLWIGDLLGILIIPVAIWSISKHAKSQKQKPTPVILYRLSMSLYMLSIIASLSLTLITISACSTAFSSLFFGSWLTQQFAWMIQWCLLVLIFFFRLVFVFKGTSHALSKCTMYSFMSAYFIFVFCIILSFVGFLSGNNSLFVSSYTFYLILSLFFALWLPFLFVYKLVQLKKSHATKTVSTTSKDIVDSKSNSKQAPKSTSGNDDMFISVITKCSILTVVCCISTWTVFVCSTMYNITSTSHNIIFGVWNAALAMDINTTFFCVMFCNNFADKQYRWVCGWMDNSCRKCCFKMANGPSKKEMELSSYVEKVEMENQSDQSDQSNQSIGSDKTITITSAVSDRNVTNLQIR